MLTTESSAAGTEVTSADVRNALVAEIVFVTLSVSPSRAVPLISGADISDTFTVTDPTSIEFAVKLVTVAVPKLTVDIVV